MMKRVPIKSGYGQYPMDEVRLCHKTRIMGLASGESSIPLGFYSYYQFHLLFQRSHYIATHNRVSRIRNLKKPHLTQQIDWEIHSRCICYGGSIYLREEECHSQKPLKSRFLVLSSSSKFYLISSSF